MNANLEKNEVLTVAARWGEVVIVLMLWLLFGFFTRHQALDTGFLTARFGPMEAVSLYGPIFVAMVPPAIRALRGRRNQARPLDAAAHLLLAAGSLWLLIIFPFDFAHLSDVFPPPAGSMLGWFADDLGRVLLTLQVIIGPISAALDIWRYVSFSRGGAPKPA